MKQSQKDRIIKRLLERGEISRNECLRNYISRLGAYIVILKKEGWEFETEERNGDYIYRATKTPYVKTKYRLQDGREITLTEKL